MIPTTPARTAAAVLLLLAPVSAAAQSTTAGRYLSEEAEAEFTVRVQERRLMVRGRYGDEFPLTPLYRDAFSAPGSSTFRFVRDAGGRLTEMRIGSDRVWDLPFQRR